MHWFPQVFGLDLSISVVSRTVVNCLFSGQYFYWHFQNRSRNFPNTGTETQRSPVGNTQCGPCPVFRLHTAALKTEAMSLWPSLGMASEDAKGSETILSAYTFRLGAETTGKVLRHSGTATNVPPLVNHQLFLTVWIPYNMSGLSSFFFEPPAAKYNIFPAVYNNSSEWWTKNKFTS